MLNKLEELVKQLILAIANQQETNRLTVQKVQQLTVVH